MGHSFPQKCRPRRVVNLYSKYGKAEIRNTVYKVWTNNKKNEAISLHNTPTRILLWQVRGHFGKDRRVIDWGGEIRPIFYLNSTVSPNRPATVRISQNQQNYGLGRGIYREEKERLKIEIRGLKQHGYVSAKKGLFWVLLVKDFSIVKLLIK